jgi:hypothetical protein
MRIRYSIELLLIVVTLAIFWQIRNHEFVWTERPHVENLNWCPSSNGNAVRVAVAKLSEDPCQSRSVPLNSSQTIQLSSKEIV